MIKLLFFYILILLIYNPLIARETGETEITTEDGIEVFQEEKYYLLKKNVNIQSDELNLNGQIVKIFFDEDLYDIRELIANDKVDFVSDAYNISGMGNNVRFDIKNQIIFINGKKSVLYLENTEMQSDGEINLDNIKSSFYINGLNSKLISDNIYISGSEINGNFEVINDKREIANLTVEDEKKLNITTDDIVMFSKRAIYNKKKSIIELFEDVEINRGNEVITGDYGILNTKKNSYKVSSNNSKKVKAVIMSPNE